MKGTFLLMEKKIKFTENPTASKIVYAIVVAILAVSAIVVGIISAASTKDEAPDTNGSVQTPSDEDSNESEGGGENEALTFASPANGSLSQQHSATIPVFSETLGAWRIHTGIDICTDEGADVYAAAGGEVTKVFSDNLLGLTVEITHSGSVKTVYSNLADDGSITVSVGDKVNKGDKIGTVGDTSISELAEEAHLHFEMLVNGASVNPLDYIAEDSQKTSLGIDSSVKA